MDLDRNNPLDPPAWLVRRNLTKRQWEAVDRAIDSIGQAFLALIFVGTIVAFVAFMALLLINAGVPPAAVFGLFGLLSIVALGAYWICRLTELADETGQRDDA